MNINDSITEEPLIRKLSELKKKRVNFLKYSGIKTIDDFLYADIDSISCTKNIKSQLKGLKKVLRYKYLHEYIPKSEMLDNVYYPEYDGVSIDTLLEKLGFVVFKSLSQFSNNIINESGPEGIKVIDIIREISIKSQDNYYKELAEFYIEYYKDYQTEKDRNINKEKLKRLKIKLEELDYKLKRINYEKAIIENQINNIEIEEDKAQSKKH